MKYLLCVFTCISASPHPRHGPSSFAWLSIDLEKNILGMDGRQIHMAIYPFTAPVNALTYLASGLRAELSVYTNTFNLHIRTGPSLAKSLILIPAIRAGH